MVTDLPDYTTQITVNVSLAEALRLFATKAEAVEKKSAADTGTNSVLIDLDPPAKGKKTGLILVIGSTNTAGDIITIYALQGGILTIVLDYIRIPANDSKLLVFPCWIPTQDVGDGVASNIEVRVTSTVCAAEVSLFVLYFEE
jgi:hypothetical protein